MVNTFGGIFGVNNLTIYKALHNDIPKMSFTEDNDKNGRSDLIEWLLEQELN